MNVMPEKNPDIWTQIWTWLTITFSNHNQLICGVVIAMFTSITKSFLYGKSDTIRRVLAEAVLCGVLAGASRPIIEVLNFNVDLVTPIGAAIGLTACYLTQAVFLFSDHKKGKNDDIT